MKKSQKGFVVLIILILLVILTVLYWPKNNSLKGGTDTATNACGFKVTSISPNSKVSFPLTVKGEVDNTDAKNTGCSWSMFEGQAGIAQLYFKDDLGWVVLGASAPVKVDDWMTSKTNFVATLNFNNDSVGLTPGTIMKILFQEENASGGGKVDSVEFPMVFQP